MAYGSINNHLTMKYKEPGIYDKYLPYLSICTKREQKMILLKNQGMSFAKV